MRHLKTQWLYVTAVSALMLVSCHTRKKSTAHHSRQPKFFDDIYISKHSRNAETADAIDRNAKNKIVKKTTKPKTPNTTTTTTKDTKGQKALKEKYAEKLEVSPKTLDNATLYQFVDEWYGVPYHMGGLEKTGIDCSGFVLKLYNEVYNMPLPHSSQEQYAYCRKIKNIADATEGDLVFFRTLGKRISHVGIYLWNDFFVHASTSQGIVISSLHEDYWKKHYAGVGRADQ